MSYTLAAIKAAKEVQADTFAPEFYRLANEWFFQAKNEYKYKNFKLAQEYTKKARHFAEQAEFEAIRSGGVRSQQAVEIPEMSYNPPASKPYEYPKPEGTPADVFQERKTENEKKALEEQKLKLQEEQLKIQEQRQKQLEQMIPFGPSGFGNPPVSR